MTLNGNFTLDVAGLQPAIEFTTPNTQGGASLALGWYSAGPFGPLPEVAPTNPTSTPINFRRHLDELAVDTERFAIERHP